MFSKDDQICKKDRIIESLELPKIAGSNFQISDLAAPPRSARPVSHPTIFPNLNYLRILTKSVRCPNCEHLYYW